MIRRSSFYVASCMDRRADVADLSALLVSKGLVCAFSWNDHLDHKCSRELCGVRGIEDLASLELTAAHTCDLFVGLDRLGRGSHVELGAAVTGRALVILVGVTRSDSAFYSAPGVLHVASIADMRAIVDRLLGVAT